jgi:hypothetical protein
MPYRVYLFDIGDGIAMKQMDPIEKMVLHCIFSRSCNGHVREKHIKSLVTADFPNWAIPYIVKVCDEYVVEILEVVYDNLKGKNTDPIKAFCADNRLAFCRSYDRMVSYWNEYYRSDCYRFRDYVGRKLFLDCFGGGLRP